MALGVVIKEKKKIEHNKVQAFSCFEACRSQDQLQVRQVLPFGISFYESVRSLINELMKDAFQK